MIYHDIVIYDLKISLVRDIFKLFDIDIGCKGQICPYMDIRFDKMS